VVQSPGHCANLMNPDMREMGIAYAFDAASAAGHLLGAGACRADVNVVLQEI